jgi:hypothetical protein
MPLELNQNALAHARALIEKKQIDKDSAWELTPADENAILGDPPDYAKFALWHLGDETAETAETKGRYKYAFGKNEKVYRSALTAIRQRAGQQDAQPIFDAAGTLIDLIDNQTFAEIKNVQIFRPGMWHGRTYTNEDMDIIAANSNAMLPYFRAKLRWLPESYSVKINHGAQSPFLQHAALGMSARYYVKEVDGERRVFADFANVPDLLAEAIKHHFPDRSVEKYRYFLHPDTGAMLPDVVSSVAFLGAIPPEVKKLSDKYDVLFHADVTTPCDFFVWREQPQPYEERMTEEIKKKLRAMWEGGKAIEEAQAAYPDITPAEIKALFDEWAAAAMPLKKAEVEITTEKMQQFSEGDVNRMIEAANAKMREEFAAQIAQRDADVATAQAAQRKTELQAWYDAQKRDGLPAAFDTLQIVDFAVSLHQPRETFAEKPTVDHFRAIMTEVTNLLRVTRGEKAANAGMTTQNFGDERKQREQEYMKMNPSATTTDAMKAMAMKHPELYKEK